MAESLSKYSFGNVSQNGEKAVAAENVNKSFRSACTCKVNAGHHQWLVQCMFCEVNNASKM